jgi:AraC-like DNA-binding protein
MTERRKPDRARADHRLVVGCLADELKRARVHGALREHAAVIWLDSLAAIRRLLQATAQTMTVVVGAAEAPDVAAFAREMNEARTGTPIVVCCEADNKYIAGLAAAGVHDLLIGNLLDQSFMIRSVVLGAPIGGAGDLVLRELRDLIPDPLTSFVTLAVRRPRDMQRVSDVADALNVPRQTLGRWCRDAEFVRPEELLIWSRLFLVAALLEVTDWTVEAIGRELDYASSAALRNRLRAYTGLTATALRRGGIEAVTRKFDQRLRKVGHRKHRTAHAG